MTLNQILQRVKTIALAHKQVRSYYRGQISDFLSQKDRKYAAVLLQDEGGTINTSGKSTSVRLKIFVLDLVHVSSDTVENEEEVFSDTLSIATDLVAQFNNPNYDDWKVSADNNIEFVVENDQDMSAGVSIDLTISIPFTQNVCAVPSTLVITDTNDDDMGKPVYDVEYIATGNEGLSLDTTAAGSSLNVVTGQKILTIIREGAPLHKVSNLPDPAEYTWDNALIGLGAPTNQPIGGKGERFLILYRKY